MTSESGHGSRKRLRTALLEAANSRGANLGTTAAVAHTLYEHHLLSEDADLNDLREAAKAGRRKWKNMYTYTLKLPLDGVREFAWCVSNPILTLQFLLDHAPCSKDLLNLRTDGLPMDLCCYHDEIVPGNVLHPDSQRRTLAIYIGFRQWKQFLGSEFVWLPVAVLRTSQLKQVQGGLSNVMRLLLLSWTPVFHGQSVQFGDARILLPMKLWAFVMDEAAMRSMWNVKGAAGRRPCALCKNCISKPAGASLETGTISSFFKDITCVNITEFEAMTDADAWEAVDHLDAQQNRMSKGKFEELQKNIGMTFNPLGVLTDANLRDIVGVSQAMYDSLHCYWIAGGISSVEVPLFANHITEHGFSLSDLQQAVSIPVRSRYHTAPAQRARVVSENYLNGVNGWKASGSEQMDVLPLLHAWAVLSLKPTIDSWPPACQSFLALCERLYLLLQLERSGKQYFRILLEQKQAEHFALFVSAHGRDKVRPKHHFSLHHVLQFDRNGMLVDTKAMERKHQALKREVQSSFQNLQNFEERLLHNLHFVQSTELNKMGPDAWKTSLVSPYLDKDMILTSETLRVATETFSKGVVLVAHDLTWAGVVQNFTQRGHEIHVHFEKFRSSRVLGLGLYDWQSQLETTKISWTPMTFGVPAHWRLHEASLFTIW